MKPILFSTPMVQAILAGRKTQTRRVINPQPVGEVKFCNFCDVKHPSGGWQDCHGRYLARQFYLGDILYVRETWGVGTRPDPMCGWIDGIEYRADESLLIDKYDDLPLYPFPDIDLSIYEGRGWRPSIHMPKEVARIFLRVTGVRAERVQDISEQDIAKEGINAEFDGEMFYPRGYLFKKLWDSLNAKRGYGWDTNPWVFVYEFEQITKEEAEK